MYKNILANRMKDNDHIDLELFYDFVNTKKMRVFEKSYLLFKCKRLFMKKSSRVMAKQLTKQELMLVKSMPRRCVSVIASNVSIKYL